jgi:UDP-N-acetylmuramyl pentapeptide phosphotransferase/UDP-N-acetylglucosamine-1-phosphate transferase
MNNFYIFLIVILLFSFAFEKKIYLYLLANKILDRNQKKKITVTGYGIFYILLIFIISILIFIKYWNILSVAYIMIPLSLVIIGTLGFLDDNKEVSVILRLIFFFTLTYLSMSTINTKVINIFIYERLVIFIIIISWVYFVNCSNFMDGGDQYLVNAYVPLFGFLCFYYSYFSFNEIYLLYNIISIIFLLFLLKYNRFPSKAIMGDCGSLSLGFIFFFNVLKIFEKEHLAFAIVLTLFFFSDVTITLISRIILKKNIFARHLGFFIHVARALKIKTYVISKYIFYLNFSFMVNLILMLFFKNLIYFFLLLCILFQIFYLLLLIKFKVRNFISNQ